MSMFKYYYFRRQIWLLKPTKWVPESDRNSLLLFEQGWIGLFLGKKAENWVLGDGFS